jgi:hypothetical protein
MTLLFLKNENKNAGNRNFAISERQNMPRIQTELTKARRQFRLSSGLNDISNQRRDVATDLRDLCNAPNSVGTLTAL